MPNWCEHSLKITGPEAERKRFMAECFTMGPEAELKRFMAECFTMEAEGLRFDFDKLIPMPQSIRESVERSLIHLQNLMRGVGGGENPDEDWYTWSCAHWGTKWNAADTKVTPVGNGNGAIMLRFSTAWSIPWPIYEELAERFPLLTIEGEIVEESGWFGGHICCHSGKIDYEDKSEQIKAEMAEWYAKLEREFPATTGNNSIATDDDGPPF